MCRIEIFSMFDRSFDHIEMLSWQIFNMAHAGVICLILFTSGSKFYILTLETLVDASKHAPILSDVYCLNVLIGRGKERWVSLLVISLVSQIVKI